MRILLVHRKLSVIERCPYQRGVCTKRFDCNQYQLIYITAKMVGKRGSSARRVFQGRSSLYKIYLPNARFWKPLYYKYVNQRTSRRTSGERQEVERKRRQQGRQFINLKKLKLPCIILFVRKLILAISRDPKLINLQNQQNQERKINAKHPPIRRDHSLQDFQLQ